MQMTFYFVIAVVAVLLLAGVMSPKPTASASRPAVNRFVRLPVKRRLLVRRVEPGLSERLRHITDYVTQVQPGTAVRISISKRAIELFLSIDPPLDDLSHYTVISRVDRWLSEAERWLEAETQTPQSHTTIEPYVSALEKLAAECERRTAALRGAHSDASKIVLDHIGGPV